MSQHRSTVWKYPQFETSTIWTFFCKVSSPFAFCQKFNKKAIRSAISELDNPWSFALQNSKHLAKWHNFGYSVIQSWHGASKTSRISGFLSSVVEWGCCHVEVVLVVVVVVLACASCGLNVWLYWKSHQTLPGRESNLKIPLGKMPCKKFNWNDY